MESSVSTAVRELEEVFGKGNSSGYGSNVIVEEVAADAKIDEVALAHYKTFVGIKWTTESVPIWMGGFKKVWEHSGAVVGLLSIMQKVGDAQTKVSLPLLTEFSGQPERGQLAMEQLFQNANTEILALYNIGDGAAISGVLLCGKLAGGVGCSVMAMMD